MATSQKTPFTLQQALRLHPCASAHLVASHWIKWQSGKELFRLISLRELNADSYQPGDSSGNHLHLAADALDIRASSPHTRQTGWQCELRLIRKETHGLHLLLACVSSEGKSTGTIPYRQVDLSIHVLCNMLIILIEPGDVQAQRPVFASRYGSLRRDIHQIE